MSEKNLPEVNSEPLNEENQQELRQKLNRGRRRSRNVIAVVAVLGLIMAVATTALLVSKRSTNGAGRPVPMPRNIETEQPIGSTEPQAGEQTISVSPETLRNANIKVEAVGEQSVGTDMSGVSTTTTGTVQPNAYRTTPVVSLVGGIVRRVNAELGQNVARGQTMVVIISDDLAMAQSKYLAASADLEEHLKHHARTMKLVEIGAASREELEQVNTQMRTAEAEVASQRQRLLLLGLTPQRVSQLKSSSQVSSDVSLPAPISGTVISRNVNPGEVIAADRELIRIADLSSIWIVGQVYEKDLARIKIGSGATITSDAYPGRVFRGRISYVDPAIDQATRTAQVRVELANPGQILKIGMFVNVAFATLGGSETRAAIIPKIAVQNLNNQQVVFVVTKEPNVFVMRPIRIGPEANGFFTVLEGVNVDERIVTEGSFLLRAEWLKLHPHE